MKYQYIYNSKNKIYSIYILDKDGYKLMKMNMNYAWNKKKEDQMRELFFEKDKFIVLKY